MKRILVLTAASLTAAVLMVGVLISHQSESRVWADGGWQCPADMWGWSYYPPASAIDGNTFAAPPLPFTIIAIQPEIEARRLPPHQIWTGANLGNASYSIDSLILHVDVCKGATPTTTEVPPSTTTPATTTLPPTTPPTSTLPPAPTTTVQPTTTTAPTTTSVPPTPPSTTSLPTVSTTTEPPTATTTTTNTSQPTTTVQPPDSTISITTPSVPSSTLPATGPSQTSLNLIGVACLLILLGGAATTLARRRG